MIFNLKVYTHMFMFIYHNNHNYKTNNVIHPMIISTIFLIHIFISYKYLVQVHTNLFLLNLNTVKNIICVDKIKIIIW